LPNGLHSDNLSYQEDMPSIYDVVIFDENQFIGILGDIVESILFNMQTSGNENSGEYTIDWSDIQVYAQWDSGGKKITRNVKSVEINYDLEKEEIRVKSLSNPLNWFILEDVIENRRQLIPLDEINEIKKRFL